MILSGLQGPGSKICDLRSWRRHVSISGKVKALEEENALLKRLAAHSGREVEMLRKLLYGTQEY